VRCEQERTYTGSLPSRYLHQSRQAAEHVRQTLLIRVAQAVGSCLCYEALLRAVVFLAELLDCVRKDSQR